MLVLLVALYDSCGQLVSAVCVKAGHLRQDTSIGHGSNPQYHHCALHGYKWGLDVKRQLSNTELQLSVIDDAEMHMETSVIGSTTIPLASVVDGACIAETFTIYSPAGDRSVGSIEVELRWRSPFGSALRLPSSEKESNQRKLEAPASFPVLDNATHAEATDATEDGRAQSGYTGASGNQAASGEATVENADAKYDSSRTATPVYPWAGSESELEHGCIGIHCTAVDLGSHLADRRIQLALRLLSETLAQDGLKVDMGMSDQEGIVRHSDAIASGIAINVFSKKDTWRELGTAVRDDESTSRELLVYVLTSQPSDGKEASQFAMAAYDLHQLVEHGDEIERMLPVHDLQGNIVGNVWLTVIGASVCRAALNDVEQEVSSS